MDKIALKALKMLREIKAVVISTVKDGEPHSRIIDQMHQDENGLIFATQRSKPFYRELMETKKIAMTGMTKDYEQVRLIADVKIADEGLDIVYDNNPPFEDLFPDKAEAGKVFEVFRVYKGKGEIFDLSGREVKMIRERFAFGGEKVNEAGLKINEKCISCGKCAKVCPFGAISNNEEKKIYEITPKYCDECGICYNSCPVDAIELSIGM